MDLGLGSRDTHKQTKKVMITRRDGTCYSASPRKTVKRLTSASTPSTRALSGARPRWREEPLVSGPVVRAWKQWLLGPLQFSQWSPPSEDCRTPKVSGSATGWGGPSLQEMGSFILKKKKNLSFLPHRMLSVLFNNYRGKLSVRDRDRFPREPSGRLESDSCDRQKTADTESRHRSQSWPALG